MRYRYCRMAAEYCEQPTPHVQFHSRERDQPGLIATLGNNLEAVSPELYFAFVDSGLHGLGVDQRFTLDGAIHGDPQLLREFIGRINRGEFTQPPADLVPLIDRAHSVLQIAPVQRYPVFIAVRTFDVPLIVKTVGMVALENRGSFSSFHAETLNSVNHPGVPVFFVEATAGFATRLDAERAAKQWQAMDYDDVRVTKLYERHGSGDAA